MKLSSIAFASLFLVSGAAAGCTASDADSSAQAPESEATTESELRSPTVNGTYVPSTGDDDQLFANARIATEGSKRVLHVDVSGHEDIFDLTKTKSGAYVFTSGPIEGDCDDPGCSYLSKYSGVIYLKKVGAKKVWSLKITATENHPHPEYDGDLEGESSTTLRWKKR